MHFSLAETVVLVPREEGIQQLQLTFQVTGKMSREGDKLILVSVFHKADHVGWRAQN